MRIGDLFAAVRTCEKDCGRLIYSEIQLNAEQITLESRILQSKPLMPARYITDRR